MIQELGSSPLLPIPSLAGLLSQAEDLAPAAPQEQAKSAPAAGPDPTGPDSAAAPAAALEAFPAVLEAFAYRYQLDLGFQFSFADTSEPAAQPAALPAAAAQRLPTRMLPGKVEPGSRRAVALAAFQEVRSLQVRSFSQHVDRFASRFPEPTAAKVRGAGQSVARAFRVSFNLDVSFLQQFARQSATVSEYGEQSFGAYLELSDTLSLSSGEQAKGFFDQVDALLSGAQEQLQATVPAFLQEMAASLGLSEQDAQALGDLLGERIDAFFATAAEFLDQAEARILALGTAPEVSAPAALPAEGSVPVAA